MNAFTAIALGGVGGLCAQWAFWVITVLVQSTALLAAGFLAVRLARSQGPAMQSVIMRAVLVAVFLSPVVTVLTGAAGLNKGLLDTVLPASAAPEPIADFSAPAPLPRPAAAMLDNPAAQAPENGGPSLYVLLASAGLATTLVLLLRIAGACMWMRRLRLGAAAAPHSVQKACLGLAAQLRVPAPTVLVSGQVNSPCLVGIANPAIVLTELSMTGPQLGYVLYHELAHLARRDGLWNLAGRVMRALLFYQPLIYPFTARMESLNDEIADDYVVLFGGGGADYAEQLTSVAERCMKDRSSLACAGVMAFNCSLGRRVQRILDSARPMALYVAKPVAVAITGAGFVMVAATALLFGTAGGQTASERPAAVVEESAEDEEPLAVLAEEPTPVEQADEEEVDEAEAAVNTPKVAPGAEKYHADVPPRFVNDRLLVGKWETVDFVDTIEQFDPASRSFKGEFYLKSMEFMAGGRTSGPWVWSNGVIYHPGDRSVSHYSIQDFSGQRYLLFEWISGDVTLRGMDPKYYVLKYVGASTAPAAPVDTKVDPKDYISDTRPEFVDDPYVLGRWESVDFVSEMADFEPGVKKWPSGLFLKELVFYPQGRITTGAGDSGNHLFWTHGAVWSSGDHTLARYTINEDGKDLYMFFEWVSGDVTIRGMKPKYYVLKRVSQ